MLAVVYCSSNCNMHSAANREFVLVLCCCSSETATGYKSQKYAVAWATLAWTCAHPCSALPKHNTQAACQGLRLLQGSCHRYFHTVPNKAGTHWANEHHWGLFNFTNVGVIVTFSPPCIVSPLPLCASSIVPECHGLSHEAGLSTGIYEQRNKLEPSDWKHFPPQFIHFVCVVVGS